MTYTAGQLIQASDLITFIGNLSNTAAYPNLGACANKIAAIYGVGYGNYGYGQSSVILSTPIAGQSILSQDWFNLLMAVQTVGLHTNTNLSAYNLPLFALPTTNYLSQGNKIATSDAQFTPPGVVYNWSSAIAALNTNRTSVDASRMTQEAAPSLESTRTTAFNTIIEHEFTATFVSVDAARFFFNANGQIRITAFIDNGSYAGEDAVWATFLDSSLINLGYWSMSATNTSQIGGTGAPAAGVGYYNLTTSYQDLLITTFGSGPPTYTIKLQAKTDGDTTNGGNGNIISFKLILDPDGQTITVPLHSEIYNYRPKNAQELGTNEPYPITVGVPDYQTIQELSSVPGPSFWSWTDVLSGRNFNYNVMQRVVYLGYDPSTNLPLGLTVILSTGTELLSADRQLGSFYASSDIPTTSKITLVVQTGAVIAGRGGQGGEGAPSGACGCLPGQPGGSGGPALRLEFNTKVINYGIIGGGGGGGGGGGAECAYIWNASAGGGGGGAGTDVNGGQSNTCGVTAGRNGQPGQSGTVLLGGVGGNPGNLYTARGGDGGNLGLSGFPGQTINAPGGEGGPPGNAIEGVNYLASGSQLGDLRGDQVPV
jgi:hypothetical protein